MFAHDQAKAATCSGCGFPLEETTAVGRDDAYDAELIACHACAAADRALNAFRQAPNADTAGLRVRHIERPGFDDEESTLDL